MKFLRIAISCIGISAFVVGCASGPGPRQGDIPPRLVMKNNTPVWDNAAAFGPVPAEIAAVAEKKCSANDTKDVKYKATGYHSRAEDSTGLDEKGKPVTRRIRGGGYYCEKK